MRKFLSLFGLLFLLSTTGCRSNVPPGQVGIVVELSGSDAGKMTEVSTGYVWVGFYQNLYLFPTFQQNEVWTKSVLEGKAHDESITFQTKDGMSVNADFGIAYTIMPGRAKDIFTKYRKGIEEITDMAMRNSVRDALVKVASTMPIESVYGEGKAKLMEDALRLVQTEYEPLGIKVEKLSSIGDFRLPQSVIDSINAKNRATQDAQRVQNEVAQAQAEAAKKVASAEGEAKSILAVAGAQAKANQMLAASITSTLVEYERVKKWNGVQPTIVSGGGASLLIQPK